jgi:hypothetical protein
MNEPGYYGGMEGWRGVAVAALIGALELGVMLLIGLSCRWFK